MKPPHPASCCCDGECLPQILNQMDGSEPYYVKYLVAALREARIEANEWAARYLRTGSR